MRESKRAGGSYGDEEEQEYGSIERQLRPLLTAIFLCCPFLHNYFCSLAIARLVVAFVVGKQLRVCLQLEREVGAVAQKQHNGHHA